MLALSRKQTLFLLLILLSILVALAISMTVIRATNPLLWQHLANSVVPNVWSHY